MSESDKTPTTKVTEGMRGAYLAVLPEGWSYSVEINGPEGAQVVVTPGEGVAARVAVNAGDIQSDQRAETFGDGMKAAVTTVKTLDKVWQQEQAARKAREEMLAALTGGDTTPKTEEPAPKAKRQRKPAATPAPADA
jgi:fructose-specific phosphotransferase system component IIB